MPTTYQRDKIDATAARILEAFETPGQLPKALARVFITPDPDAPARRWSWGNRLLIALYGHQDARTFRQWKAVGHRVKKGERAFHLLRPVTIPDPDAEEEGATKCIGCLPFAVFGLSQTEGPLVEQQQRFLDSLPLYEVAEAWGLRLTTSQPDESFLGSYSPEAGEIRLCVENTKVWMHELVHAADHRVLGSIQHGQHQDQEIVAELGASVLLEMLGLGVEADRGGAWSYLRQQGSSPGDVLSACNALVGRTCDAVQKILETAAMLTGSAAA